ncbi:hypothetical protein Tco_0567573 [Tanacetum coccineum]
MIGFKNLSVLEVHGAAVSNEDANKKILMSSTFLRNNVALIMRNKTSIGFLDIVDLYFTSKCLKLTSKVHLDHLQTLKMWPFSLQKTLTILIELILLMVFLLHQAITLRDNELGYDWSYIAQDEPTEFALMASLKSQDSLGSDTEANLEIVAYKLGLESVEAQLVVHQKNEVVYEEKIAVLEFEVKDKVDSSDSDAIKQLIGSKRVNDIIAVPQWLR